MSTKPYPIEPENIACKICLDEIPGSVASSQEGAEYAQHFCGIDCFSIWQKESEPTETRE